MKTHSRPILREIDGGGTKGGNEGHEVGLMGNDSDAMRDGDILGIYWGYTGIYV